MNQTIDGIINENNINFVGKDGFFWWVGEVEDNEDPMELGRVRVRVLGYYTNVRGGTTADLKTDHLPWATVLQHTSQAGNDGQGESSGQLQPGAVVMGFFMDGDDAQMPIVIGVMRVNKATESRQIKEFAFTGESMKASSTGTINPASNRPGDPNGIGSDNFRRPGLQNNSVSTVAATTTTEIGGKGSPLNVGMTPGINGSAGNPQKPRQPEKPIPAANGVGGPWKSLDYTLSYLIEDLADQAGLLVKSGDGQYLNVITGTLVTNAELTAKIQNFLGTVFTQVVSAMRTATSTLIDDLELSVLLNKSTGAPYVIQTTVQAEVSKILSSLCAIDNNLTDFINTPLTTVTSNLDSYLGSLIDKPTFVTQGVEGVISIVICNVEKLLNNLTTVVSQTEEVVANYQDAKEVLDTWKAGNKIFSEKTNLFTKDINTLTGLIKLFVEFSESGCVRPPKSGEDNVGWFPLFGVTHCTPEEFASIAVLRGETRGKCGESTTIAGGLFDSVFSEADPYLTTAKTQVNGSFELYVGTPGRQATIIKRENGTTHTSVSLNNAMHQEWMAKRKIKEDFPDLSEDEVSIAAAEAVAASTRTTSSQTAWVRSADNLPDGVQGLWSDFLKTYGVYPSNTSALLGTHTGTWEVVVTVEGTYTFDVQADNQGSISWDGVTLGQTSMFQSHNVTSTFTIENVQAGTHTIKGSITNVYTENAGSGWERNPAAIAWTLKDPTGTVIKTSLDSFPVRYHPSTAANGDEGNLLADHISWAGTKTEEVHGDDAKVIDNDYCRTVQGDYRLKVTGDCHIEVGGGFFFSAQGAPKSVSKHGHPKNKEIQKHVINFGSDVDMNVAGAAFEMQAANLRMAATKTSITGKEFENASKLQKYSGVECIISADNSIEMVTTALYQKININKNPAATKSGISTICHGSVDLALMPGGSTTDNVPRFTVANPSGPVSMQCGSTGFNLNVMEGAYNVMAHDGLIRMESKTGPATIKANGAIGINSVAGAISQTATSIFLN